MIWKNRFIRTAVYIVSFMIVISVSRSIGEAWGRGSIVQEREMALENATKKNDELKRKFEEVQTPAFIEREARDKLGMTKEGEVVVLLPEIHSPDPNDLKNRGEDLPSWKQWWKLFF